MEIRPKRWLITGGCGFIGTSLISSLLKENADCYIRVLDNLSTGTLEDLKNVTNFTSTTVAQMDMGNPIGHHVDFIEGDILDAQTALKVTKGMDCVVHLAANTGVAPSVEAPRMDCETNVIGTFNYLEAARHCSVKRFIFASSGAPAGEVSPPIHEELPPHPVSPYGASKLAGEGYCSAYSKTFGLETIALRFGNVYGPLSGHKNSVVAQFIKRALDGFPLEIYGDGTQTRDFIYIEDLIHAIKQAARTADIGGEVFQIATSQETTVKELAELLSQGLTEQGVSKPVINFEAPRQGDVMRNFSDTSKAAKLLNWSASTPLADGLRRTIRFFLQQRSVKAPNSTE